jgi:hypothetical protein
VRWAHLRKKDSFIRDVSKENARKMPAQQKIGLLALEPLEIDFSHGLHLSHRTTEKV